MENYTKGETKEVNESPIFPVDKSCVGMKVNAGSKIRNLIGFALAKFKEEHVRQMSWSGSGNAIAKTVSCAEIMKRKLKNLHQVTKIRFRRIEEYWEPKIDGLERLKVNKDIPAISILLSKDPLDTSEPGYQAPGPFDTFWTGIIQTDKPLPHRPRPSGSYGARGRGGRKGGGKDTANRGDNCDTENGGQAGASGHFQFKNRNKKHKNTAGQSRSDTVTGSNENNTGRKR